jgi:hypothetical protein
MNSKRPNDGPDHHELINCSGRIIPFDFGQKPKNEVEGYEWGRHYQAYIRHCAKQRRLYNRRVEPELVQQALAACGMRNVNKFHRRRHAWNEGASPIPLAYLDFIGVDIEMLREAVALDEKEWQEALQKSLQPQHFIIRLIPAVYGRGTIPPGLTEEEAIQHVQEFQASHPGFRGCCINWPGIKAVNIWPDRPPTYSFWCPRMRVKGGQVRFAYNGGLEGVTRLGG